MNKRTSERMNKRMNELINEFIASNVDPAMKEFKYL